MKNLLMISFVLTLILLSNGCSQKEPEVKYVKQKKFDFQAISLEGAYISLKGFSDKDKEKCVPKLKELNTIYKGIKEAYDIQFNEYDNFYKKFNTENKK